jgi:hypothetical protein
MSSPTQAAEDLAASGLTELEFAVIRQLGLEDALNGARDEARNSGLPSLAQGPANAYQHLLISGELWRRLGPIAGPIAAAAHEIGNDARGDQTAFDSEWTRTTTASWPASARALPPGKMSFMGPCKDRRIRIAQWRRE